MKDFSKNEHKSKKKLAYYPPNVLFYLNKAVTGQKKPVFHRTDSPVCCKRATFEAEKRER
jgi:hypothetical protein